jgi:hypothetical protein
MSAETAQERSGDTSNVLTEESHVSIAEDSHVQMSIQFSQPRCMQTDLAKSHLQLRDEQRLAVASYCRTESYNMAYHHNKVTIVGSHTGQVVVFLETDGPCIRRGTKASKHTLRTEQMVEVAGVSYYKCMTCALMPACIQLQQKCIMCTQLSMHTWCSV